MDKIVIRLSALEDTVSVRELAIYSFQDTFGNSNTPENMETFLRDSYSLEKMQEEFYEPGSVLYLACLDTETIVGFLRLRKNDEVIDQLGNNSLEIQRIYVHPDYKGKGIGQKLMKVALAYGIQKKVDWIWLGVWEMNSSAIQFYNRWGFEKFGEHIFQMGDDAQTDWLFKKKID